MSLAIPYALFCVDDVDIILICNREKKKLSHYRLWGVSSTPSPFHFLVHLHVNLVGPLVALFTAIMATQMIGCHQFSCHFAVCTSKEGSFQYHRTGRRKGTTKGVDETQL